VLSPGGIRCRQRKNTLITSTFTEESTLIYLRNVWDSTSVLYNMRWPLIVFQNFHLLCEISALLHGYCKNVAHSYYWSNFLANISRDFQIPSGNSSGVYTEPSGQRLLATFLQMPQKRIRNPLQMTGWRLVLPNSTAPVDLQPENKNQDRSQCKPLRRRNNDLLTDSVAISIFPLTLPPPPQQTNIGRKRDFYYTVIWEAAEKLMALVWFFLEGGGYR
jgi:hypothetical protein